MSNPITSVEHWWLTFATAVLPPDAPEEQQRERKAGRGDGDRCARINTFLKNKYGPRDAMEEKQLIEAIAEVKKQVPDDQTPEGYAD